MIGVLRGARAELRRLTRPSYLLSAIGLPAFFAALVTVLTFNSVSSTTTIAPRGGPTVTMSDLTSSGGFLKGVETSFTFLGLIVLVLAAMAVATDYGQGTLRNLLVRQPTRWKLLSSKLLALLALVFLSALAATATGSAVARFVASGAGVSTSAWQLSSAFGHLLGLTAGLFGWAAIGALVATVLRSVPAAIGVGVGWALPVEGILGSAWKAGKAWFPGGAFEAIASGGSSTLTLSRAIIVAGIYVVVAIAAAQVLFARREITA